MPATPSTIFGAVAAISALGYLSLLRRKLRHGGWVFPPEYTASDFTFALILAGFFGSLAWAAFLMPPPKVESMSTTMIWASEFLEGLIIVGVAAYLVMRKISVRQATGTGRYPFLRVVMYALGMMLLAMPAVMFASWLISLHLPQGDVEEQAIVTLFRSQVQHRDYAGVASILITAAVLAPAMEEFLFRGFLYGVFKRYAGAWVSALITAGLFAALHGSVAALGGLFLLALALTAAYECTGSLWVPIGMHALFNSLNLLWLFGASW